MKRSFKAICVYNVGKAIKCYVSMWFLKYYVEFTLINQKMQNSAGIALTLTILLCKGSDSHRMLFII